MGLPGFAYGGQVGVAVFFALLITALLLEERRASGTVAIIAFYRRRARRLLPALLAMLAVVFVASLVLGYVDRVATPTLAALLYVANWGY